jgi:hypothetical protein
MVSRRRSSLARAVVAAASLVAGGGCSFPEEPIDPGKRQLVVHAVLDPARRVQTIEVDRTHGGRNAFEGVQGAIVSLTTPDGVEMRATSESGTSEYRIDLDTHGATLVPGATYTLRVRTATDEVTGTTTIPGSPVVTEEPTPYPFTRATDTLRLSWAAVPGAETYEVEIGTVFRFPGFKGVMEEFRTTTYRKFTDRPELALAGTAKASPDGDDVFERSQESYVIVMAVDPNYYAYYRVIADPFAGVAPTRLTGGLGVFGSVVPVVWRRLDVR